jgi:hypothetical protein
VFDRGQCHCALALSYPAHPELDGARATRTADQGEGMDAQATGDPGGKTWGPHNTVTVVDPSPVNWLSITWNTMEEANRVDHDGIGQPSLAESWRWLDGETLELRMRETVYQDGEPFNAAGPRRHAWAPGRRAILDALDTPDDRGALRALPEPSA